MNSDHLNLDQIAYDHDQLNKEKMNALEFRFAGHLAAREFGENVDPHGTPFRVERVNS
jgi:hypothetical protein